MEPNNIICRQVEFVTPGGERPPFSGWSRPAEHPHPEDNQAHSQGEHRTGRKGRLAFIWGVSGSILSAVGFLAITLYQQYCDTLNELRHDLNHFHEISGELVRKESLRKMREKLIDCFKELRDSAVLRSQVEHELAASQEALKDSARELQHLRERLAAVEGRQAAVGLLLPQQHAKHGSNAPTPPSDARRKMSLPEQPQ